MNKCIAILFALVATLFTANALAFTPPPAPEKGWYVVDQTGRLTPAQINLLNQKIERISKATKNEFGILLAQDMGGDNIEDAANATFKAWGIGKRGLDNGCLIMVALKERKTRIETGKGVEGEIPDLKARDILDQNLRPHLKAGDFYGGFDSTLDALSSYLESRQGQKADPPPAPAPSPVSAAPQTRSNNGGCDIGSGSSSGLGVVMLLAVIGVIGLLWARAYSRRKQQEEEERQARLARDRARKERIRQEEEARLERLRAVTNTPVPPAPIVTNADKFKAADFVPPPRSGPPTYPTRPAVPRPNLKSPIPPAPEASPTAAMSGLAAAAAASAAVAAAEATAARLRREREEEEQRAAARRRREREEREAEERRAEERRARTQREEEERQAAERRRQEEESSRSSYSYSSYSSDDSSSSSSSDSSSSFDWGGSSGSDSGGGFGGGDSGGGGASSDF